MLLKRTRKCQNPLCLKYDMDVHNIVKICPECAQKTEQSKIPSSYIRILVITGLIISMGVLSLITPLLKPSTPPLATTTVINLQSNPQPTVLEPEIILRIHGSNTIGAKLAPATAEEFLKKKGATDIKTINSKAIDELLVVGSIDNKLKAIEIFAHGSGTAFEDMQNQTCDIGMSSRKINAQELDNLSKAGLGKLTTSSSEYILGLDGIAIIVNSGNTVSKLTKDQLIGIFSGQTKDWSEVGGTQGKINIYSRDDKSGTYDTFKTLILGTSKLAENTKRYEDSIKLSDDVSKDITGIGFIGLPYINNSKAVPVTENAALSPILPTSFSVATEDYTLTRRLYYYYSTQSKNTLAKEFIEFSLSSEGQKIVTNIGFVSQDIKIEKSTSTSEIAWKLAENKDKFNSLVTNSLGRFSLNFRFDTASTAPDNKSLRDLDRIVQYLNQNKDAKVILLGFSDNEGDYSTNVKLSETRAIFIKDMLISRDPSLSTRLTVLGFGPEQPVATNDTDTGKMKNRRVELWLTK